MTTLLKQAGAGVFIRLVITCLLVQVTIYGWCENSIIIRRDGTENKYVFYRKEAMSNLSSVFIIISGSRLLDLLTKQNCLKKKKNVVVTVRTTVG